MSLKLSIVVPCYNEKENISLILEHFSKAISKREDIEVILVDNGSDDGSAEVFETLCPSYPFSKVHKVELNQGYGHGVCSGLKVARGNFIGWTHADMQTDPKDVIKALELIEKSQNPESTYVKGQRQGRALFDQFFTTGMSIFETIYLKMGLYDINAQPNVFHRSFFESLKDIPKDFSLDLFFLYQARKNGLELIRFPVIFPKRIHGHSKWNTGLMSKWKFIKRTIDFSRKLKREHL